MGLGAKAEFIYRNPGKKQGNCVSRLKLNSPTLRLSLRFSLCFAHSLSHSWMYRRVGWGEEDLGDVWEWEHTRFFCESNYNNPHHLLHLAVLFILIHKYIQAEVNDVNVFSSSCHTAAVTVVQQSLYETVFKSQIFLLAPLSQLPAPKPKSPRSFCIPRAPQREPF